MTQTWTSLVPSGRCITCSHGAMLIRTGLKQSRPFRSRLFGTPLKPSKVLKILPSRSHSWACRAELFQDAPFVAAIGACIISSLVLQKKSKSDLPSGSVGEDDVRNGAITIISFIPLFNWLSWVFAWLDTNDQRYLLYACAYLAPYVRTGFSFSTDENWLLFLGYFACIAHVQLEINSSSVATESGKPFFQDGLRQLQQSLKLQDPKEQSKNFDESISTGQGDSSVPVDEDISKFELSEFDKKLSARNTMNKEVATSKNPEKYSGDDEKCDE